MSGAGTAAAKPRFFIDHGTIHDRMTSRHVQTGRDDDLEDGTAKTCALLNELAGNAEMPPVVCAVLDAAERLAEEVWSDNRLDEELEALCRAVTAMRDAETPLNGTIQGESK